MNISLKKSIDQIIPEIEWSFVDTPEFNLNEYSSSNINRYITLSNGSRLAVSYDNHSYTEMLGEKYKIGPSSSDMGQLVFVTKNISPAKGYIDLDGKTCYVIGDSFGLFKSAISGFCSYLKGADILPVHGSGMHSDEIGGLITVGGHAAGKSTALVNLSGEVDSAGIVSDDWLLVRKNGRDVVMNTTDHSVSVSSKMLRENQHIVFGLSKEVEDILQSRKVSLNPSSLGIPGISGLVESVADKVLILVPGLGIGIQQLHNLQEVARFIVTATYHYPYMDQKLVDYHIERWISLLDGNLEVFGYDREGFSSMQEGFRALLEKISN